VVSRNFLVNKQYMTVGSYGDSEYVKGGDKRLEERRGGEEGRRVEEWRGGWARGEERMGGGAKGRRGEGRGRASKL
jgi:hypothetical protein